MAGSLFSAGQVPHERVNQRHITQSITQLDETERTEQSYPLNADGRVRVSNVNGSVSVDAWEKNEVRLEVIKKADSRETLNEVEIKINSKPGEFSVEADFGNSNRRGNNHNRRRIEVEFKLTVPAGAFLDGVETVNGSVTISKMTNYSRASAVNGAVSGVNLRGTAELSTVNGTVSAEFDTLQRTGIISLDTVNGSAKLMIPSDADATVRAETLNGTISNDFGLPVRKGRYIGSSLYGQIGSGDTKIKLESVNGGLTIVRRDDGKNLNPAVDLLPSKSADSEDDDFDSIFDSDVRRVHIDLQQARLAAAEARKTLESSGAVARAEALSAVRIAPVIDAARIEAMRTAVAAIEPEIARINEEAVRLAVNSADMAAARTVLARELHRNSAVQGMRSPFVDEKTGTFAVKGKPTVRVETLNCPVYIRGWDRNDVSYSMTRVASRSNQMPVEINAFKKNDNRVEIKVINQNAGGRADESDRMRVRLEVFVPKKSNLLIKTNDEIRLEGVSGDVELVGENGDINVRDSEGTLSLRSMDALVRVIGFRGDLAADTNNSRLFLEGDFENISAKANEGLFVLTLAEEINADITSNIKEVSGAGVKLVRADADVENAENYWRIGVGGRSYSFQMESGKVIVRSREDLEAS